MRTLRGLRANGLNIVSSDNLPCGRLHNQVDNYHNKEVKK